MVGKPAEAQLLAQTLLHKIEMTKQETANLLPRPLVYIEEWDEPMITAIKWFSQLVELCGATVLFRSQSQEGTLAAARVVEWSDVRRFNPDIMLACWCGKALDRQKVLMRPGAQEIKAIAQDWLLELDPAVFLQPGPAPIVAGIDVLSAIFKRWRDAQTT
jgi:iron complex transport system substrate-binding protein